MADSSTRHRGRGPLHPNEGLAMWQIKSEIDRHTALMLFGRGGGDWGEKPSLSIGKIQMGI